MVFVRKQIREFAPEGGNGRVSRPFRRTVGWIAIPGAVAAMSLWSVAILTGISSTTASIASIPSFLPHAGAAANAQLAVRKIPSYRECEAECPQLASIVVQRGKSTRSGRMTGPRLGKAAATTIAQQRFDRARAELSSDRLKAAFAHSEIVIAKSDAASRAESPLDDRFYPQMAKAVSLPDRSGPAQARFGQEVIDVERSSRLALALAAVSEIEVAYAPEAELDGIDASPAGGAAEANSIQAGDEPVFEAMPDSVPLPGTRPELDRREPSRPAMRSDQPARTAKRSGRSGEDALAYARPDDPSAGGIGQAFKNLFKSPGQDKGVAIYDISAATVIMPDGTRLEAHSGMGHMADNVKYADQKMRGPTPPGTYNLTMRESRFHGVEAIRLTPSDGRNKFGRDGLLAHTEMLRGRPEQSNGCVAFKDYARFLKAFKKGHIKRLVVVPGRSRSNSRIASNGSDV